MALHLRSFQVPELNVQNGVLKALSFLFEYIGEMGKDYIYAGGRLGCSTPVASARSLLCDAAA